jgi:hypothetical protein
LIVNVNVNGYVYGSTPPKCSVGSQNPKRVLEGWKGGMMEGWNDGRVEWWKSGRVEE